MAVSMFLLLSGFLLLTEVNGQGQGIPGTGCSSDPCQNEGTCFEGSAGINAYFCQCTPYYKGTNCETNRDCSDNPCENNALCCQIGDFCYRRDPLTQRNDFFCLCSNNWFVGITCSTNVNCFVNECQNGGTCIPHQRIPFCSCTQDFTGDSCETPVDRNAPIITLQTPDTTVHASCGLDCVRVYFVEPEAMDRDAAGNPSPDLPVSLVDRTHIPGNCFMEGPTAVTYTFADQDGNTVDYTFDVTINMVAPLMCDTNIPDTIQTVCPNDDGTLSDSVAVDFTEPRIIDSCGPEMHVWQTHRPGESFPVDSTTTVWYLFSDENGLRVSCSVNVIVENGLTASPRCPDIPDVRRLICPSQDGTNQPRIFFPEPSISATNCGGGTETAEVVGRSHLPGDAFDMGSERVTYTFRDSAGRTVDCGFDVVVYTDERDCVQTPPVTQTEPQLFELSTEQIMAATRNYNTVIDMMPGRTYDPDAVQTNSTISNMTVIELTEEQQQLVLAEYRGLFVDIGEVQNMYSERRRKRQANPQASEGDRVCLGRAPDEIAQTSLVTTTNDNVMTQVVRLNRMIQWSFHEECDDDERIFPCRGIDTACGTIMRHQPVLVWVLQENGGFVRGQPKMRLGKTVAIKSCVPLQ